MQKLVGLRAENHKRIQLVEVEFPEGGGTFAIMGENEAGKTSLIDALESTIAGRKGPKAKQPVRNGADVSTVIATFTDLVVQRVTKRGKPTQIKVTNRDGLVHRNGEEVLAALYAHIALDPLAFARLPDAAQVAELLPMIGFDPAPLDAAHDAAYAARTVKKREADAAKARLDAAPAAQPGLPSEFVSVSALSADLEAALAHNAEGSALSAKVAATGEQITRAREAIVEMEAALQNAIATLNDRREKFKALETHFEGFVPADVDGIRARMESAEDTNAAIRAARTRADLEADAAARRAEWEVLDADVTKAKADKKAALVAAADRMPVDGLTIDDESGLLMLNGSAFADTSTGAQIRTGIEIGAALNPELRLMIIRDASLLDATNRAIIDELAKKHGLLVLLELADESGDVGVILEDGLVREVRGTE